MTVETAFQLLVQFSTALRICFSFRLIELINTLSKQQVTPTLVQRQYDLKTLSEGSSVTIHAYNQIWKRQVLLSSFLRMHHAATDTCG